MFDVYADEIIYQGLTVGRLELPTSTLRDRVLEALYSCDPSLFDRAEAADDAEREVERLQAVVNELEDRVDRLIGEKVELKDEIAKLEGED
jgi:predicted nuclease with TOPRIM domain